VPSAVKEDEPKTSFPAGNNQPTHGTSGNPVKQKKLKTWAKLGNEFPPALHDGKILWQGNGEVLDYNQHCYRKMTLEEAAEFRDLGFENRTGQANLPIRRNPYPASIYTSSTHKYTLSGTGHHQTGNRQATIRN